MKNDKPTIPTAAELEAHIARVRATMDADNGARWEHDFRRFFGQIVDESASTMSAALSNERLIRLACNLPNHTAIVEAEQTCARQLPPGMERCYVAVLVPGAADVFKDERFAVAIEIIGGTGMIRGLVATMLKADQQWNVKAKGQHLN